MPWFTYENPGDWSAVRKLWMFSRGVRCLQYVIVRRISMEEKMIHCCSTPTLFLHNSFKPDWIQSPYPRLKKTGRETCCTWPVCALLVLSWQLVFGKALLPPFLRWGGRGIKWFWAGIQCKSLVGITCGEFVCLSKPERGWWPTCLKALSGWSQNFGLLELNTNGLRAPACTVTCHFNAGQKPTRLLGSVL